jgi:sortase (surface protein transpeptidase)
VHRRRSRATTLVRLLLALVAVCAGGIAVFAPAAAEPAATVHRVQAVHPAVSQVVGTVSPRAPAVAPVRVAIPAVGIDSTLARLGTDAAGALVPPADFAQAGWFTGSPAPGAVGPAVLAGHVDSWRGPAVFFRLGQLQDGDAVVVTRADGTTLEFTVTRVARYPKSAFPTAAVYGPTADPQLRLITCGGRFDRTRRSYVDDVVVFARLA